MPASDTDALQIMIFALACCFGFAGAFIQRAEDCLFLGGDIFSDENQLGPISLKRLHVPAAGDEIEKLRAVSKADETFRTNDARGEAICEAFERISEKGFIRTECERLELELMPMLWTREFFLASDAEQQIWVNAAAFRANNRRSRVDFTQLRFKRLDLRRLDKIDLIQKQNVRALDLQASGMAQLGETNEHIGVDDRNDPVDPAPRQRLLNVEHERFRLGETCGLDNDYLGSDFLDDFVYSCREFAE